MPPMGVVWVYQSILCIEQLDGRVDKFKINVLYMYIGYSTRQGFYILPVLLCVSETATPWLTAAPSTCVKIKLSSHPTTVPVTPDGFSVILRKHLQVKFNSVNKDVNTVLSFYFLSSLFNKAE